MDMKVFIDENEHHSRYYQSPFEDTINSNNIPIQDQKWNRLSTWVLVVLVVIASSFVWSSSKYKYLDSSKANLLSAKELGLNSEESTLPHVVFYLIDDQGFADVGYNSQEGDLKSFSPNMDKLAVEGLKFSSYYAQALCTPARAALMTGKYPTHNGMNYQVLSADSAFGLPLHHKIMPEYLQDLGYKTHILGKWHLGFFNRKYMPTFRGFDSHVGFYDGANYYYLHSVMVNDEWYQDFHRDGDNYEDTETYGPLVYMNEAADIITAHDPEEPLFLFYSQQLVHKPLEDPDESMITPAQVSESALLSGDRATFARMTAALDHSLQTLVENLQKSGMYENSIIIVSSDNGGCSNFGGNNYPFRGEKNTFFEGGVRTNAFIHSPLLPKNLKGQTYDGMFHISDWLPTLVHGMLDRELPGMENLDGIDLWPDILGEEGANVRDELLYNIEVHEATQTFRVAIRSGNMKFVYGEVMSSWYSNEMFSLDYNSCEYDSSEYTTNAFLFDLENDEIEMDNLYNVADDDTIAKFWDKVDHYYGSMVPAAYQRYSGLSTPYLFWSENDHYLTPWVTDKQLEGVV
mmetsp:Transcript_17826/g.22970  ORF Transcript_17826/g.22970 Transcript_17826/m.22970 type:complete len:574 (+) Transcript_17826:93-1814(+)